MKRTKFIQHPTRMADFSFEDYYDQSNNDWEGAKAQRIQVKRWRKLKHQLT